MRKAIVVLALLAMAVPVLAQDVTPPDHPLAKQVVVSFLGLTPDQVTPWDALFAARDAAVAPLRGQLGAVEGQLKALLQQSNPDPAAVGVLVIQGKGLRTQIADAQRTYVEGFVGLLAQDQKLKYGLLRKAEEAEPLFPAFRVFDLLPRPDHPPLPPQ